MKENLKKIYAVCIKLVQTIVSLVCVAVFNKYGLNIKINRLRCKTRNKSVSLLSGGPSAKEVISERQDLLHGTDLLVLNNFGNTEFFFSIKPKYYVLLDPAYFDVNFVIKGLDEKDANNNRSQEWQLLDNFEKVDWPMTLFLPYQKGGAKILGTEINNPNIQIIQFNATRVLGFDWFQNWMYGHNYGIPSSRNVIIPAMVLMANIGYKKIYLYGCEFSWTKTMDIDPRNGMMFFNDRHFYSNTEIRYFGKGAYKWWLEAVVDCLNATEQVEKYAKSINTKIINRTKGSFIDAFEYENTDTIE